MDRAEADRRVRLRLIARTLIEWQTPPTSPYFVGVLRELIESNLVARTYRLTAEHAVLRLDDEGYLLTFLADTLDVNDEQGSSLAIGQEVNRGSVRDILAERSVETFERLMRVPQISNRWLRSFEVGQVLDTIFGALEDADSETGDLASTILLGLTTPLFYRQQVEHVRRLAGRVHFLAYAFRRVRIFAKLTYDSLPAVAVMIGLLAAMSLRMRLRTVPDGGEWVMLTDARSLSVYAAYAVVWGLVALTRIFRERIQSVVSQTLMTVIGVKDELRAAIMAERCAGRLPDLLGQECGSYFEAWDSLLRARDDGISWSSILFAVTEKAEVAVVRGAIRTLADQSLTRGLRCNVFGWLCTVQITPNKQ